MKLDETHHRNTQEIVSNIAKWREKGETKAFKLAQDKNYSNTIRKNSYKMKGPRVDISKLNRVISIDPKKRVALVEPRVTMEKLVTATLKHDLIPLVVPEFKGITVGGAIMGTAIESSSFRYGQFNDTCKAYEILLGNGEIIQVSPNEHTELYYGLSGSYGSLGIILSAEIQLIPVGNFVKVTYFPFDNITATLDFISKQCRSSEFDYLETIVYSENSMIVVAGRNTQKVNDKTSGPISYLNRSWSPLFYDHIEKMISKNVLKEYIPTFDYLFRHDRGAFWMGSYAKHPWMLMRFLLEKCGIAPSWIKEQRLNKEKHSKLQYPGNIFRAFFGWMLNSERLYKILHSGGEKWFHDHFVIQDFFIPERNSKRFIEHILEEYQISPLWICPVLSTQKPQFLSPHWVDNNILNTYFFDIGVYGFPRTGGTATQITRKLEKLTQAYEGKKMLYGHSCYSADEFWEIYSRKAYQALRNQYHGTHAWMDLADKVLAK